MSFANETPLDDVLKYIKAATSTRTFPGIPIYVDPAGLEEAERSLNSTIQIDYEGGPLKKSLELVLRQLGLAYRVADGRLTITSDVSAEEMVSATIDERGVDLDHPMVRRILEKLEEPISMSFANETPLDDVLKYIKQATTTPDFSGIPIYVDPIGLQEAERSLNSTVVIDAEGLPLCHCLRQILSGLGLMYVVRDEGFLMITSKDEAFDPESPILARRMARMLEEPIDLAFTEPTPLVVIIDAIKAATKGPNDGGLWISFIPDPPDGSKAEPTYLVTYNHKGVSVRRALDEMLPPLGLVCTVEDGLVTITTKKGKELMDAQKARFRSALEKEEGSGTAHDAGTLPAEAAGSTRPVPADESRPGEGDDPRSPGDVNLVQVKATILDPQGMWVGGIIKKDDRLTYASEMFKVPGDLTLTSGSSYHLKLSAIPGRSGAALYPSLEVAPASPATRAFLKNHAIPIAFTDDDLANVLDGGDLVTKVVYLPGTKGVASKDVEPVTLASTELNAGIDPLEIAIQRGVVLMTIRLGTIENEMTGPRPISATDGQVYFLDPDGMQIGWPTGDEVNGERTYLPAQLTMPARYNFPLGAQHELMFSNVPSRPGWKFYATIDLPPASPRTRAYLSHSAIPIQFTDEDIAKIADGVEAAARGKIERGSKPVLTKVVYLPFKSGRFAALSSVQLPYGTDPQEEARRKGHILMRIRVRNER